MIQLQISKQKSFVNSLLLLTLLASAAPTATYAAIQNEVKSQKEIVGFEKLNSTTIDILFSNKERMSVDFYGENIFRLFQDNTGGILRDPQAEPEAQILVDNPRKAISKLEVEDNDGVISITTNKINLKINKESQLITATDLITNRVVFESVEPVTFKSNKTSIKLKEHDDEYFYGGGVQNGRFSHKGNSISIENQNSWTDGGVASPNPYYWSTNGYAAMWYTFKKGTYDFGAKEEGVVELTHESDYLDLFLMVNDGMVALLNDFYQLTGHPVLLPKFGFYQGHLNAYNRDYWVEDENGVAFEDGKKYKESQKDNGGIKESLNGENDNYQFSARAVIDRYKQHDMPFGWILPNDGYGAGYGQTDSLDGNIQNLKELHNYAVENGVEIGLWTQSDLHPKEGVSALLQRDIVKEVRDAGVRVLKTDVAWVGAGYSFGLNGVADVANIMQYYGNDSRPFIISLDGWAGTQRHAGIWSGDQTGGNWEYIRFHIPTYLGSGLSGQPNICSDMDGIFGGQKPIINTRDFQWKTFSPMQLNMDGWGSNPKYPHALGEPVTSINRWYLKLKAELMPYAYSIAKEAIDGKPMIRAMFVDYPNSYTLGKETQYQFMYGDYFLVAPIYQDTKSDEDGNDIRNGIYLPEGVWIDYFTGEKYEGGCIVSNFDSPLWKLPVFVKVGAIIPLNNPHNNVSEIDHTLRIYELYPAGTTSFTEYDDDGTTQAYLAGEGVTTLIESTVNDKNSAIITVNPTKGNFEGFEKNKATEFRVNVTEQPKKITAKVGAQKIKLAEAASIEEFNAGANLYFYDETPNLNKFATEGSEFEKEIITKNPMVLVKIDAIDVTRNATTLTIDGYVFNPADKHRVTSGVAATPKAEVSEENTQAYTLLPTWEDAENADFYEIKFQDMLYTTITDNSLLFESLEAETEYTFEIRSANKDGYSDWATFSATTKSNPLEFAITGIKAVCSAPGQGGSGIEKLFDFDETRGWHTRWGNEATPFDIIIDLKSVNQLDKFHYLPREGGGNGVLLNGSVSYSYDKEDWTKVDDFTWERTGDVKIFEFPGNPSARYIKIDVTEGVGKFGSGQELYVFKVPNTPSYIPGDINNDGVVDANDLTSYTNYTGLREIDSDFEYVSIGDINRNKLIDAYDISHVATVMTDDEPLARDTTALQGVIELSTAKTKYAEGEIIEVVVTAKGAGALNAISFAMPYNTSEYEYVGVEAKDAKAMTNLTYDRLHSNRDKALYPTFVNIGNAPSLYGDVELFVVKFKAKSNIVFSLEAIDGIIVSKDLSKLSF